jgi:hypothetical protein
MEGSDFSAAAIALGGVLSAVAAAEALRKVRRSIGGSLRNGNMLIACDHRQEFVLMQKEQ